MIRLRHHSASLPSQAPRFFCRICRISILPAFPTTYEPNSFIQPFLYHLTSFRVSPPSHICSTAVSALSVAYSSARPETSFVKLAPWYLLLQEPTTYIASRPPIPHGASYAVIGYGRGSPHVIKQLQWCGLPYGLNVSHDAAHGRAPRYSLTLPIRSTRRCGWSYAILVPAHAA